MAQRFSTAELLRMRYAMAGKAPPKSSVANSSASSSSSNSNSSASSSSSTAAVAMDTPLAVVDRLRFRNELLRQRSATNTPAVVVSGPRSNIAGIYIYTGLCCYILFKAPLS